jgi:hypothetical protein
MKVPSKWRTQRMETVCSFEIKNPKDGESSVFRNEEH